MIPPSEAPIRVLEAGIEGDSDGEKRITDVEKDGNTVTVSWTNLGGEMSTINQSIGDEDGVNLLVTVGSEKEFQEELERRNGD